MTTLDTDELAEALKPITANMTVHAEMAGFVLLSKENLAHALTEAFCVGVKYGQTHPEVDAT